jgi:hypothetical protein
MAFFPSVCLECKPPKRNPHCHATCKEYLEVKAKHDAVTAVERAARIADSEARYVAFKMKKG